MNASQAGNGGGAAAARDGIRRLPLVVVDAANVVGSVPDGWWRDRAAATERLRDSLVGAAAAGGAAGTGDVAVVAAAGSGDDAIVELVSREAPRRPVLVVTADRGLRARVAPWGASLAGPRAVRRLVHPPDRPVGDDRRHRAPPSRPESGPPR